MQKVNKLAFLILIVSISTILFDHVYAADITVHIDEKELASQLIAQIFEQLNNAKNLILKNIPENFWHKTGELAARALTLGQYIIKEAYSIFTHILQTRN